MRELIGKGLLTAAAASSVLTMTGGYAQATDSGATAAGSPGLLSGNSVQAPVEVPVNVCGNTVNPVGVTNPSFGNGCGSSSGAHAAPAHRPAHHAQPHAPQAQHAEPATHTVPAQAQPAAPRDGHDTDASSTHGANPREHGGGSAPEKDAHQGGGSEHGGHADQGGSSASGAATNSPGLLSGNLLQAPLDVPLNACGNSVDLVGLLNPAFGNGCANDPAAETPPVPLAPPTPVDPVDPVDPSSPPVDRSTPPAVPVAHDPMLPEPQRPVEESDVIDQLAETGSDANLLAAAAMSAGLLIGGGILYRRSTAARR